MTSAIQTQLQTALDTGAQVVIQTNCEPYDRYRGQVLQLNPESVSLFHAGMDGGIEWHFPFEHISFIGLIREVPESIKQLGQIDLNETSSSHHRDDPPSSCSSHK